MSLEAFGVKNLRCLTDTGLVPIRPITVLLGRNSSGKSTFLRAFPLLRQSVETARNSPILWYHERYVDFGSLEAAANNRLSAPSVTFEFRLRLPEESTSADGVSILEIAMTLAGGDIPYVSGYDALLRGHELHLEFDAQGRLHRSIADGQVVRKEHPRSLQGIAHLLPIPRKGDSSHVSYQPARELFDDHELMVIAAELAEARSVEATRPEPLLRAADLLLAQMMSRVAYLAPLRVNAQRAYRIQNLAVDEVDPDGKNLAMFLHSLSPAEAADFAAFTQEALGFETQIKTTGIHAEILIKGDMAKRFVNLVDVGFGYSEVLPLAAVLWASCVRPTMRGREPVSLIAIEQPELHLHPAHQVKLAKMFVDAVSKSPGTKIVVETHSESLINGLGKLVYDGAIKAEDVQLVLFEQDEETGETTVDLTGYDDDGALQDSWPYGFLSPVAERRFRTAAE